MVVISKYLNSKDAWKGYKDLHLDNPSRELYIFNTWLTDTLDLKYNKIDYRQI